MASPLSHFDKDGRPTMVDVSEKTPTHRIAIAEGTIKMRSETLALVQNRDVAKGDVCTISELAGIMGAKKTADLIPLCHPLALTSVKVEIKPDTHLPGLRVTAVVKTSGQTGVEMEALTAVSIACLTIYDMLKATEKSMVIDNIHLFSKSGGKSGPYEKSHDT